MHDIRAIRENPAQFDAAMARRGVSDASSEILKADEARRARIQAAETAQAEQNRASKEVGAAKAKGDEAEFERLRALVGEKKALVVRSSARRSQHQNLEVCRERLAALVADGLQIRKARRATKPTRGSQRRRLDKKRARGQIKKGRRSGGSED